VKRRGVRTWQTAVSVDVVAPEQGACFVAVGDLAEPAQGLARGRVAKVLLVDGRRVAPAQDVVACLAADGDGFLEALFDVRFLGCVARRVDRVVVYGAGVPGGALGRGGGDGDGGGGLLLAGEEGVGEGRGSAEEDEGSVCDHDGARGMMQVQNQMSEISNIWKSAGGSSTRSREAG
jgi:hypothetical protein